jgi:prepilin-type N-terminal cleavage/methylation domain-containing protein
MSGFRKAMWYAHPRREGGFTLVELLITSFIMLVLLAGVAGMVSSGAKSSTASQNLVLMEKNANEAMNTITRQIRVALHVYPESNNSMIKFDGDLGGDGVTRTQSFLVQDGSLVKDGQPWVDGVTAITFTYYFYNRLTKQEEVLVPGSFPGWNEQIHRVEIKVDMSQSSMEIDLERTYYGSVVIMNALR